MPKFPKQFSTAFYSLYGDAMKKGPMPDSKWQGANLVGVSVPFTLYYAGKPVKSVTVHRACKDAFQAAMAAVWAEAGKSQATIDKWKVSVFGGSYCHRLMRGSNKPSMHSFGCAFDFYPEQNGLGDYTPFFQPDHPLVRAFLAAGATWGGDWNGNKKVMDERRPDGMHFQFASV
jgi:hypothetical protein